MKKQILLAMALLLGNHLLSQKANSKIDINPFIRWDSYPQFIYAINSVNSNTVNINGAGWGVNAAYKFLLGDKLYIKAGIGYYKYSFNDIDQVNSLFGESDGRIIDYTPPGGWSPAILYSTNKYWYNSIAAIIGIEKNIHLAKGTDLVCGLDIRNYYTFSQLYHISYPSPEGTDYKRTTNRYFGFSGNLIVGVQKKVGKIDIGPAIFLPIYDTWKQDEVFPKEENSMSRNKWLRGFGVGINCSYSIIKTRKK